MSLGSAVGDIFTGVGDLAQAAAYQQAASLAKKNAALVKLSTGIQEDEARRQAYKVAGQNVAAAGANNEALTGSAMDTLRSNAQQTTLQKTLIAEQGLINQQGWLEKAAADEGMAAASAASGAGSILGGVLGIFGL